MIIPVIIPGICCWFFFLVTLRMALSKNWVRDFELMEADNPMALLGDVASAPGRRWT